MRPSRAIRKGERIFHSTKSAKDYHEACAVAQFKKNANPTNENSKNAQTGEGSPPNDPATVSEKIERRLRKAKAIVDKVFPEAESYADYLNIVNEAFRQLQSERWLELEKAKSRLKAD